ncbi:hypothetical protein GCM10023168_31960 [Fodinibacter luteus]|uniref:Transmembrane protein n=1 Tax=Fodinibacter luteus TaxID=552064 RepID=A0ABP8KNK1_9MICO
MQVALDTLAVSREVENGVPVDYSSIRWQPRENLSNFRYPYVSKVDDIEKFFKTAPRERSVREILGLSGKASFVQVSVCPNCMAIRTYECESKELNRGTFACSGDADKELRMSWISTDVGDSWKADWGHEILAALVGAGVLGVGAWLRSKHKAARAD